MSDRFFNVLKQHRAREFEKDTSGLNSRRTPRSGALFKQNDDETDVFSIERKKSVSANSFRLSSAVWEKLENRSGTKIPVLLYETKDNKRLVVLKYEDFKNLAGELSERDNYET